jgi:hypothetical protein
MDIKLKMKKTIFFKQKKLYEFLEIIKKNIYFLKKKFASIFPVKKSTILLCVHH